MNDKCDWADDMNARLRRIERLSREAKWVDRAVWFFMVVAVVWVAWRAGA